MDSNTAFTPQLFIQLTRNNPLRLGAPPSLARLLIQASNREGEICFGRRSILFATSMRRGTLPDLLSFQDSACVSISSDRRAAARRGKEPSKSEVSTTITTTVLAACVLDKRAPTVRSKSKSGSKLSLVGSFTLP
ncbi:hypothetical protein GOP47_0020074 [Adiantum capillus-veneris]|uniref:Uncharacterized protein n=1 Tax=Adiantum capillus-veneris TaxID=13818 RepID=A0A9D4Z8B8_ADICA|nr:hypothetical protein GOP47_0020074 [Adiantum capillus-veneris]